jgi:hypothetical protein
MILLVVLSGHLGGRDLAGIVPAPIWSIVSADAGDPLQLGDRLILPC